VNALSAGREDPTVPTRSQKMLTMVKTNLGKWKELPKTASARRHMPTMDDESCMKKRLWMIRSRNPIELASHD